MSKKTDAKKILINVSDYSSAQWDWIQRKIWDVIIDIPYPYISMGEYAYPYINEILAETIKTIKAKRPHIQNSQIYIYLAPNNDFLSYNIFAKLRNKYNFAFPIIPPSLSKQSKPMSHFAGNWLLMRKGNSKMFRAGEFKNETAI